MGPQNSDPNTPNNPTAQPDLSSVLSPQSSPPPSGPTEPEPAASNLPSPPQPSPPPQPTPPTEPPPFEPLPKPSPLDNPLGAPTQAPPIDSGNFNWSAPPAPSPGTETPYHIPTSPTELYPSQTNEPPVPTPSEPTPTQSEPAPTDLSQLAANSEPQNVYSPPLSQPETLVVPPANPEVTSLQGESGGRGIPKLLWIIGGVLLLTVLGASAYFILGIGQSSNSQSAPETQTQQPTLITPPQPAPVATPTPASTPSDGFGDTQQATSAADILRQRQQAR